MTVSTSLMLFALAVPLGYLIGYLLGWMEAALEERVRKKQKH